MKSVEAFLEEYADALKQEFDWSAITPCRPEIRMSMGQTAVLDKNGNTIAIFVTRGPRYQGHLLSKAYDPSCPVSQRDVQGAKLFTEVVNYLGASDG